MEAVDDDQIAVRELISRVPEVGWDRERARRILLWLTGGRLGRRRGLYQEPSLGTPWQDTPSPERLTWRCRGAYLDDQPIFEVDYRTCTRCRLGWVEQPHTHERYRRLGLATAGLARLRAENPGLSWHTLGGHMSMAETFWKTVGTGVAGNYAQRRPCPHITSG
ncbi:hypothetical protein ACFVT9_29660 [Kitasatospora cineracea]|uniref:hypothetical protein n=1 Tax=Kitasatospora cineracea TaxID=88074 RepID=UPI0036D8889E